MSNVSLEKSFNFGCVIRSTRQRSSSRLSETSGPCESAITIAPLRREGDLVLWFWIGTHEDYNHLLGQLR